MVNMSEGPNKAERGQLTQPKRVVDTQIKQLSRVWRLWRLEVISRWASRLSHRLNSAGPDFACGPGSLVIDRLQK